MARDLGRTNDIPEKIGKNSQEVLHETSWEFLFFAGFAENENPRIFDEFHDSDRFAKQALTGG